jgi:hypothetical protein
LEEFRTFSEIVRSEEANFETRAEKEWYDRAGYQVN